MDDYTKKFITNYKRQMKKAKKGNVKQWPFYGIFRTKRDQMWIARTPAQLARAIRLDWKKWRD